MGKKKPKKTAKLTDFLVTTDAPVPDGEAAANATPTIDSPLTNSFVPPGVDLTVSVSTNRGDLRYKVVFSDLSPPPAPVTTDVPAPGSGGFTLVVPGANIVAGRMYQVRVHVDPADGATPPHLDHTITLHTLEMGQTVIVMGD
jgi:hypothetical protein